MNFLPYLSFFAFLFNIFWSEPVRILSQEYELGHYYLTSPILVASAVLAVALALFSVCTPKKLRYIPQFIVAYVLITTALYHSVIPYDYGGFTSNEIFKTKLSLLGFSRWRYLLDVGILLLSAATCVFLFKKQLQNALFGFFLLYYITQSFFQIQATRFINEPTKFSSITLSENHTNVLYLIYDTTPSIAVEYVIKNVWDQQQKEWVKDFTLYDNTAGLGLAGTFLGLPTIFGGYQFSPQQQLVRVDSGTITEDVYYQPQYQERYGRVSKNWLDIFFSEEALEYLVHLLPNVDISYEYFSTAQPFPETKVSPHLAGSIVYPSLPFPGVVLYSRSPYFLRWIFAKSTDYTLWKSIWHVKAGWMLGQVKDIKFSIKETAQPVLIFAHFSGTHDVDGSKEQFESAITEMMTPLNDIISYMKEKSIYDRTKIIITADHGIYPPSLGKDKFLYSIASPQMQKFYMEDTELAELSAYQIPSLCMIKNFAAEQTEMAVDSRFISLADMHGVILNAFGNTTVPDYTTSAPVRRKFNIPHITGEYLLPLLRKQAPRGFKSLYMEVHSVKNGEIYVRKLENTNEASKVPAVEWIE